MYLLHVKISFVWFKYSGNLGQALLCVMTGLRGIKQGNWVHGGACGKQGVECNLKKKAAAQKCVNEIGVGGGD